jgi:prophage maintenance system killer protein
MGAPLFLSLDQVIRIVFLAINDIEVKADEDSLASLTLAVADGKSGKREIAGFFRARAH